jgi:molecular chaperone GrpE
MIKEDKKVENTQTETNNKKIDHIINKLEEELKISEAKILQEKNMLKKETTAIFDRLNKEMYKSKKFSLEKIMINFLPIFDNIERSLNSVRNNMSNDITDKLKEKLDFILHLLNNFLNDFCIKKINEINVPFSPSIHEAMSIHYTDKMESNHIVSIMQPGYILHNTRLLRPAMVVVSQKKN